MMTTTPMGVEIFAASARWAGAFIEDFPDRIGQGRDFAQSFGHAGDAFGHPA
jgi:hypothetical protein